MESVKINKGKLKAVLTENRAKHRAQYEEALVGYRLEAIKELHRHIEALEINPTHVVRWTEIRPDDHTSEYDLALRMLEMSVEDVIDLSRQEFSQMVDDNWTWKPIFSASTTKYLGR